MKCKKMKEQKKSSNTIDIVSYALEVSVNGVKVKGSPELDAGRCCPVPVGTVI